MKIFLVLRTYLHRYVFLFAISLMVVSSVANATPASDIARLYALPPEGTVYVRVVNTLTESLKVRLGTEGTEEVLSESAGMASSYHAIPGGEPFDLRLNDKLSGLSINAPETGFMTIMIYRVEGNFTFESIIDGNDSIDGLKAKLVFYNLVNDCLARLSIINGPVIFDAVADGVRVALAVNPVVATLIGSCSASASKPLTLPSLQPGDHYSLFLTGTSEVPILSGLVNQTVPYRAP
ncbi:cell division protein FtsQ [Alcaligenaceae bacterium]|nr:cell division protein FtsQ [Alcaligenaceae bacterium]